MNRSILIYAGVFVLLAAAGAVAFVLYVKSTIPKPTPSKPPVQTAVTQPTDIADPDKPAINKTDTGVAVSTSAKSTVKNSAAPRELTPEEREKRQQLETVLQPWQSAMDDNDDQAIRVESMKLMNHSDPEVRMSAVEGFKWIGASGAVGLANLMYDRDPDVAKAAAEGCLEDIREMDDDVMKADLLDMVMLNPDRLDEDTFNEALSLFDDLPERLAAEKLIEILKKTNNPEYASEEIDALQFILQADPPLDNENKAESLARAEVLFKELPPDEPKESDE